MKTPLVAAVLLTVVFLTIHVAVRQSLRMGANDPQIQLAEDAATLIAGGKDPSALMPPYTVDMAESLAFFVNVYDASGKPVVGNGTLDGAVPSVPEGVLAYANAEGQDRVTWQPQRGVRIAAVVIPVRPKDGGLVTRFVLAGRNLREVENRERRDGNQVGAGWLASMVVLIGATVIQRKTRKRA